MAIYSVLPTLDIVKLYHGSHKLCAVCEKLDLKEFLRPSDSKDSKGKEFRIPETIYLHNFWVTSRYCLLCGLLYQALQKLPDYTEICHRRESGWVCAVAPIEFGRVVFDAASAHLVSRQLLPVLIWKAQINSSWVVPSSLGYGVQVLADENESREAHRLTLGRWLDLSRADIGLLRGWITCCEEHHIDACVPDIWNIQPKMIFRVIDVKRRCLVQAPPTCTYLALSYVWGDYRKVKHLKLTKETALWIYNQGALSEDNPLIPQTIKDAITLVYELGEKYIWIDALCIQQDDKFDKEIQIPYMHKIYGCAKCTIVAGSGSDAWAGLAGIGHNPKPRIDQQHCATIQNLQLITTQRSYKFWMGRSVWATRGWTYQENVLSKRCLIITDYQVFFRCQEALWYEDTVLEKTNPNIAVSLSEHLNDYNRGDIMTSYDVLVKSFASCSFSFQGDALNAFRGLESLLQQRSMPPRHLKQVTFSSGYIWGLPESIFDWAISWVFPHHCPERRRTMFPSWSWAGWNYDGIYMTESVRFPDRRQIGSEIVWHRRDPSSPNWISINSACMGDLDSSRSEPEEGLSSLWKPNNEGSLVDSTQPSAFGEHILRFWTSTLHLPVDRSGPQYKRSGAESTLLGVGEGTEMMAIRNPYTNDLIRTVNLDPKWRANQPDSLEFIVISRCTKYFRRIWEHFDHGLYVMLIEWKDDIAYRVQMVDRPIIEEIWVELKPEWKLINLG